ncbi:hypothetical protein A6A04_11955 [Paramagnetospirillum marisnigri]|uniref:DUF2846 domain-containing protein n=1 Tax=Paramagnetospirillum marisnigri TaxID=1285242 RepID=A0A178MY81_9PROT|nr:hypothetical protein [Paramagnetospirillum marisnigri]OAN54633.1 hypothetical protein A6A04_11955 [Paramagnetospirillum marisnigri]
MLHRLICLGVVVMLGACASSSEKFQMPRAEVRGDLSRLVLYRTGINLGFGEENSVSLNGGIVCFISPGEVMVRDIRPGEYRLALDNPSTPGTSVMNFKAEPGKTVYISAAPNARRVAASAALGFIGTLLSADKSSSRGGNTFIEQVTAEVAKPELEQLYRCSCAPPGS